MNNYALQNIAFSGERVKTGNAREAQQTQVSIGFSTYHAGEVCGAYLKRFKRRKSGDDR